MLLPAAEQVKGARNQVGVDGSHARTQLQEWQFGLAVEEKRHPLPGPFAEIRRGRVGRGLLKKCARRISYSDGRLHFCIAN